ncbi:MAG: N-acetylmuramoyl-L-alanine amidase [Ruminococcus sp.]
MKRKKHIVVMITAVALCFVIMAVVNSQKAVDVSSKISDNSESIIVLDAGHGGEDGGAVSSNGVVESDINLQFTEKLKDILSLNGYQIVMTRDDDCDLADKSIDTVSGRKKSDMHKRLDIYNADIRNIAISIHQNIFPADSCNGTQVFYSTKVQSAKTLADNITDTVKKYLQSENQRVSKPTNGSIFLLDNAKIPAVIVECGFLSNNEELKQLCDQDYQKKFSYCVFLGLLNTEI